MNFPQDREEAQDPHVSGDERHGDARALFRPSFDTGKWHSMLADHSPSGMALLDQDLNFLVANHAWLREFSLNLNQIVGKPIFAILEKLQAGWEEIYQLALQGKVSRCETDVLLHQDGIRQSFYWEVRPWRHANSRIGGILVSFQKIAAQQSNPQFDLEFLTREVQELRTHLLQESDALERLRQELVRTQEENLRRSRSDAAPLATPQAMLDAHRALVRAVEDVVLLVSITGQVLAISPEPNLPLPIKKVGPEELRVEQVLPPLATAWQRILAGAATDDQPTSAVAMSWESEHGLKYLECRGAFAGNDHLILTIRDVTRLQEHGREVQRQKSLFEKLPQAIFKTDRKGRISLWNSAAQSLFGIQEEEIFGTEFWSLLFEGDQVLFREKWIQQLSEGKTAFSSIPCRTQAGETFLANLTLLPHYPAQIRDCLMLYGVIDRAEPQQEDFLSAQNRHLNEVQEEEVDQLDMSSMDHLLLDDWNVLQILKQSQLKWESRRGIEKTSEIFKQQIRWLMALRSSLLDQSVSLSTFIQEMWKLQVEMLGRDFLKFELKLDVQIEDLSASQVAPWVIMIREMMIPLLEDTAQEISDASPSIDGRNVFIQWGILDEKIHLRFEVDRHTGEAERVLTESEEQGRELIEKLAQSCDAVIKFPAGAHEGTWLIHQ